MASLDALFCQPLSELLKASRIIKEDFMLELASEMDVTNIELEFGGIDAEYRLCHDRELLV